MSPNEVFITQQSWLSTPTVFQSAHYNGRGWADYKISGLNITRMSLRTCMSIHAAGLWVGNLPTSMDKEEEFTNVPNI